MLNSSAATAAVDTRRLVADAVSDHTVVADAPITMGRPGAAAADTMTIALRAAAAMYDLPLLADGVDRTGLMVWPGARVFAAWAGRNFEWGTEDDESTTVDGDGEKPRVFRVAIELGAGLGIGALAVAAVLPRTVGIATDFFTPALEMAAVHAEDNAPALRRRGSLVVCQQNDWTAALHRRVRLRELCPSPYAESLTLDGDERIGGGDDVSAVTTRPEVALLGLDVVYPDTRFDVLCGLVLTVRDVLLDVRLLQERDARLGRVRRGSTVASVIDDDGFHTVFVQRDTGATLRRLVGVCAAVGLVVDPLGQVLDGTGRDQDPYPGVPFTIDVKTSAASSISSSPLAWAGREELLARSSSIGAVAVGRGVWLLRIRLPRTESTAPAPLTANQRKAALDGLEKSCPHSLRWTVQQAAEQQRQRVATGDGGGDVAAAAAWEGWLRYAPWIWHDLPYRAALHMAWDASARAIVVPRDDEGHASDATVDAPNYKGAPATRDAAETELGCPHCRSARVAADAVAAAAEGEFFAGFGGDSDDD